MIYLQEINRMKKRLLQIIVPFAVGSGMVMAFGYPLPQALISGIGGIIGIQLGYYIEKRRAAKKMNG